MPLFDLTKSEAGNFTWIWTLLYRTAVVNAVDPQLINQLRVLLGGLHYGQRWNRVKKYPGRYPVLQEYGV